LTGSLFSIHIHTVADFIAYDYEYEYQYVFHESVNRVDVIFLIFCWTVVC